MSNIENTSTPGFLFLINDDASWEHFGCFDVKAVKTTGTDMLAENGMLFTNTCCTYYLYVPEELKKKITGYLSETDDPGLFGN